MAVIKDVTDLVEFGRPDDEFLPLTKCKCGKRYEPWEFNLSIYASDPSVCDNCGTKLYFSSRTRVWEVIDNG